MSVEINQLLSTSYGRAADVVAGSVSGLVGGITGGIVLQMVEASHVLTQATPALAGLNPPTPIAGWFLFLLMSFGVGLVYAGLLGTTTYDITSPTRGALAGAAYGIALWLTVAIVLVPMATAAVGYAGAPPFPYIDLVALAGYLCYGVAIGVFHAAIAGYRSVTITPKRDVTA